MQYARLALAALLMMNDAIHREEDRLNHKGQPCRVPLSIQDKLIVPTA